MEYSIAHSESDAMWWRRRWQLVLVIVLRQSTAKQEHVPETQGFKITQQGHDVARKSTWRSTSPEILLFGLWGVPSGNLKAASSSAGQHSSTYLIRRSPTPCRRVLAIIVGGEPGDL